MWPLALGLALAQVPRSELLPPVLVQASGAPIDVPGGNSAPFWHDLDGDGLPDLLVGQYEEGCVRVYPNVGTRGAPRFAEWHFLRAGVALEIQETNAAPCVADWDGDGAHDLLLGTGDGSVLLYRNEGAPKGEPALAAPRELLPKSPDGEASVRFAQPGTRSRVAVCDWNADGRLDLLVGEYASDSGPAPVLTAAQEKELAAALRESFTLGARRGELERKALAGWLTANKIAPARSSEVYDDFLLEWLATPEARAVTQRQDELAALQRRLNPALLEHGRVWIALRRGL